MSKQVTFPPHAPFKFVPAINDKPAGINTGHLDTELQANLLRIGQDKRYYKQKVQRSDRLRFMVSASPLSSITLTIIDAKEHVVSTISTVTTAIVPGTLDAAGEQMTTYLFKAANYNALTVDGVYFLVLTIQWPDSEIYQRISEPLQVATLHPHTIRIDYRHSINKDGSYFEQLPCVYVFRVEAAIANMQPASSDVVYEDQGENLTLLDSTAFRTWSLLIGHAGSGICDWVLDKLNRIFSLDNTSLDNKRYLKAGGAKWTKTAGATLYGASIDIREAINDEGFTHNDASMDLYASPGYPYAIGPMQIGGMTISSSAEIANSTAETAFIAAINAGLGTTELLGSVVKTGGIIQYINAPGEHYTTATVMLYTSYFSFNYTTSGTPYIIAFDIKFANILVNWGDSTLQQASAFLSVVSVGHGYAGPGFYTVKVWGITQQFSIAYPDVSGFAGALPSILLKLSIQFASFTSNTFNCAFIAPCAANLQELTVSNCGLVAVNNMPSYSFTKLRSVNFSGNSLPSSVMNQVILDVKNNAFAYIIQNGNLTVAAQTPPATLNSTGSTAKMALQLNGWQVFN